MRTQNAGLSALAGLLAILGLFAALAAALVVSPGRNMTDSADFADAVVAALQSSAGEEALTESVAERTAADSGLAAAGVRPAAAAGVSAALSDQSALDALGVAARTTHEQVVAEDPSDAIRVDLDELREPIVDGVAQVSPEAAQFVPGDLGSITVASGEGVRPVGRAAWWVGRDGVLVGLVFAAVGLIGLSLLLSWDRMRAARGIGIALLLVAAVPIVISFVAGPIVEAAAATTAADEGLAGAFAAEIAALRLTVPVLVGGAGAALVAASFIRTTW